MCFRIVLEFYARRKISFGCTNVRNVLKSSGVRRAGDSQILITPPRVHALFLKCPTVKQLLSNSRVVLPLRLVSGRSRVNTILPEIVEQLFSCAGKFFLRLLRYLIRSNRENFAAGFSVRLNDCVPNKIFDLRSWQFAFMLNQC